MPWLADHGWVRAVDLREGDPLLTPSGEDRVVVSLNAEEVQETVYNIEVDEFHTYFVGESFVFVHNADYGEVEIFANKAVVFDGAASEVGARQVTRIAIRDFDENKNISSASTRWVQGNVHS